VNEQECEGEYERKQHQREHAVGPAAPPLEVGGGAGEVCEGVYVGEIGADDQRRGTKCRPPGEAAPRQSGTNQGVTERVYSSLASISIFTLPSSAPETGHPFLAASAALANAD
jgi:hypothetical protein